MVATSATHALITHISVPETHGHCTKWRYWCPSLLYTVQCIRIFAAHNLHKSPEPAPPIPADMALNKLELTTPSLMSSEPDDYTEKNPDLLACSSVVYEARDSTPGVKFKTQSGCDGWTPVTQAESRRRPEHGNGTKANPKIPDYSWSELPVKLC